MMPLPFSGLSRAMALLEERENKTGTLDTGRVPHSDHTWRPTYGLIEARFVIWKIRHEMTSPAKS
jgi:hypothetical protein